MAVMPSSASNSSLHLYTAVLHLFILLFSLLSLVRIHSSYTGISSSSTLTKRYFSFFLLSILLNSAIHIIYSYLLYLVFLDAAAFDSDSASSASSASSSDPTDPSSHPPPLSLLSHLSTILSRLSDYSFLSFSFLRTIGLLGLLLGVISRFTKRANELGLGGLGAGILHIGGVICCWYAFVNRQEEMFGSQKSINSSISSIEKVDEMDWLHTSPFLYSPIPSSLSTASVSSSSSFSSLSLFFSLPTSELYQLFVELPLLVLTLWIVIVAQRQWRVLMVPLLWIVASWKRFNIVKLVMERRLKGVTVGNNIQQQQQQEEEEESNSNRPTVILMLYLTALLFFYFSDMSKEPDDINKKRAIIREVKDEDEEEEEEEDEKDEAGLNETEKQKRKAEKRKEKEKEALKAIQQLLRQDNVAIKSGSDESTDNKTQAQKRKGKS